MNNRQLQEAIDKTRAFLMPQMDSRTTPSFEAKRHAVETLEKLQDIQVMRASLANTPRSTLGDIK